MLGRMVTFPATISQNMLLMLHSGVLAKCCTSNVIYCDSCYVNVCCWLIYDVIHCWFIRKKMQKSRFKSELWFQFAQQWLAEYLESWPLVNIHPSSYRNIQYFHGRLFKQMIWITNQTSCDSELAWFMGVTWTWQMIMSDSCLFLWICSTVVQYDRVRINQIYEQAKWSLIAEHVQCTDEQMMMFAALQVWSSVFYLWHNSSR